ncbi:hypothetical protein C6N01_13170 [Enterococcus faecalis]|uniref:anthrax toxin lethal factor-related metalloendopeptidase n=1 Tax=Enterococcus faecalis TaxID=1351 RepID=UPI001362AA9D|nr:ADP-ribosyltransferase [Enterococcus faecalis]NBJ47158.1 hypothetical protein [Enterococcus faecalis]
MKSLFLFFLMGISSVSQVPMHEMLSFDEPYLIHSNSSLQVRQDIDHKTDEKEAKKWAEERYKKWDEQVSNAQKEALQNVLKNKQLDVKGEQLNHHLQYLGGDLNNFHVEQGTNEEKIKFQYEEDVKLMDRTFKIKEGKTQENLFVYKNISLTSILNLEFGTPLPGIDENLLNGFSNIDRNSFNRLKSDLKYGLSSSYLITNIAEKSGGDERIKLRIYVPKGTASAYDGETHLIFNKNNGLLFKDFSIITQNGKEYIRINTELVDKAEINKKIAFENEIVNREFNNRLGFAVEKRSIDFDFKGIGGSISIKEVNKELNMAIDAMDPKLAENIYGYMLNNMRGRIIFTDLPIWAIGGMKMPDDKDSISGLYRPTFGTMYIRMPFSLNEYNKDQEAFSAKEPILHETGHVFDHFFGEKFNGKSDPISSSKTFKGIYTTEKGKLTDYAKTNEREFFAEAFRMYHVSPDLLKKLSPKTYTFIDMVIKMSIENYNEIDF